MITAEQIENFIAQAHRVGVCRFDRLQQWQSVLAHRRGGFGVRYRFLGALFDKEK